LEDFKSATLVQKVKIVEDVLDKEVRYFLQQDGGDCEVINIEESTVYINYTGACSG